MKSFFVLVACFASAFAACPDIVSRAEWGARPPYSVSYQPLPIPYVVFHHAVTESCYDFNTCASLLQGFQDQHMDVNGWSDIGYNFLVGEDGLVYEGRGWEAIGAHAPGFNGMSIGVCFIGTFTDRVPNDLALDAADLLNDCGIEQGYLYPDFGLMGHRQAIETECPGDALYEELTYWPNFEPNP